jgi:pimeloyl-ACP methyl ester carboxylesterase
MIERTFLCSDGFQLAAQLYAPPTCTTTQSKSKLKVLLLHGWLDNCRTFWKLAPALAESREVVALDLPGHGLSDHRPKEAPSILLAEAIFSVAEVLQQMRSGEEKVTLIGHSMGGAISLAYAATFPEQVDRLVLLESLGPLYKPEEEITQHLRKHVETRLRGNASMYGKTNDPKGPRLHASLEAAMEARMKTVTLSPGNQYISKEAAQQLVTRATKPAPTGSDGVQFTHDYRLTWPSLMYTTPGQVAALQEAVQCVPTCLLLAHDGWPIDEERLQQGKQRIHPQHFQVLPGSHHFHADPDTCEAVIEQVIRFLDAGM